MMVVREMQGMTVPDAEMVRPLTFPSIVASLTGRSMKPCST